MSNDFVWIGRQIVERSDECSRSARVSAASLRGVKRRAERPRWTGRRAEGGGAGRDASAPRVVGGAPACGRRTMSANGVGVRRRPTRPAEAGERDAGERTGSAITAGGSGFRGGGMRRRVSRNGGRRGHSTRHRGKAGGRDAACEGSAARRRTGRGPAEPPRLAAAGESTDRRSGDQAIRWSGGQVVRRSNAQPGSANCATAERSASA